MENNTQSIDIFDILIILAKRKKFLIVSLLIVSVLVVTYSLLVTQKWTSSTTFKPTLNNSSQMGMLSSVIGGNFGSLLSGNDGSTELVSIVTSRTFLEDVIDKFDLLALYEIEDEDPYVVTELILKKIRQDVLSVGQDPETGIITISITTKERNLSPKIANYMRIKLENYLQDERMTKGKEERQFLEKRVTEINKELETYTLELKKFQEENNVLELESQLPPMLSAYTDLVASYQKENLKYQLSKKFVSSKDKKNDVIKFRRDEILNQIKKIEQGNEEIISYQVGLNKIPDIAQKYALLKTKMEILKKVYETIYPQYEMAKLQELRDTQTLNLIDNAIPAGLRTWPRRGMLCVVVFIISAFALMCYVIVIDLWDRKLTENDKLKNKYEEFRSLLSFKR